MAPAARGEAAGTLTTLGRAPRALEDFRKRVEAFLERITNGKELSKVRLMIEAPDGQGDETERRYAAMVGIAAIDETAEDELS